MRYFYFLFVAILIASSSFATNNHSKKSAKTKCLRAGGEWGTWSKYDASKNIETCRYLAKDAGKSCNDGKECTVGLCEYDSKTKSGQCAKYQGGYGCHTWLDNGQTRTICAD